MRKNKMYPQKQNCVHVEQAVCPNCGYCPHCGRANAQPTVQASYTGPYVVPVWNGQPFVTGLSVAT